MITETWKRYEAWLSAHRQGLLGYLNPPAKDADVNALEALVGFGLPEDFRCSLFSHDGQREHTEPTLDWTYLCVSGITSKWSSLNKRWEAGEFDDWEWIDAQEPALAITASAGVRPSAWRPGWLPFLANGDGDLHCLDCDPAPGGQVGQVITVLQGAESRICLAPSFSAWFSGFVDDVVNDRNPNSRRRRAIQQALLQVPSSWQSGEEIDDKHHF